MNKYINAIEHEILLQIKNSNISLIRIEGINSPIIYGEIVKYLKNTLMDTELVAKLSKEKYDEFRDEEKEEWNKSIEFLEQNDYVDYDGAMTAWRNKSVDFEKERRKTNVLILLMGTESVQDKGGLADFYLISGETLLKKLKKKYSRWFEDLFKDNGLDEDNLKSIDTIFKAVFNNINVDLLKLSCLIDDLEKIKFYSVDEIIEEIFMRLNEDWGIPSIRTKGKLPKNKNLKAGKATSAEIIAKAHKFITRQDYRNGLKENKIQEIRDKIDEYYKENSIDESSGFPLDNPVFKSFAEFKEELIEFIQGKRNDELRQKFLKLDFSVVDDVLKVKIKKDKEISLKDKVNKLIGYPLEVYSEMISKSYLEFKDGYDVVPQNIEIKVNEVNLSNCSTDEEKENLYLDICSFLGGILKYISESVFLASENICLAYENNIDPFDKQNIEGVNLKKSSKINSLSKIGFTVRVNDGDECGIKKEFTYIFESTSSWIQNFSMIRDRELVGEEVKNIRLPLYAMCKQISEYTCCESDEEFFIKLQKIKLEFTYEDYFNELSSVFATEKFNIQGLLGLLCNDFKAFMINLNDKGYFDSILMANNSSKLFTRYAALMKYARENYDNLTSIQRDRVHLILNLFMISNTSFKGFLHGDLGDTIIPPYHPVMLEKIYHKNNFLRNGFDEIITLINNGIITDKTSLEQRLIYYSKMSIITSGCDAVRSPNKDKIITKKMHGAFAVYNFSSCNYNLVSDKIFDNDLIDDEDIDKKELIKQSHKSKILSKNIEDYLDTFPSSSDGMNIIFINPDDMQHVIAGIHDIVEKIKSEDKRAQLNLRFVVSDKRKNGADYLRYWLDAYFQEEENIKINTYLNYIDLNSSRTKEIISKYLINQDIAFVYDILDERNVEFRKVEIEDKNNEYKYPSIFTPLPISITQEERAVDISQRQFECANENLQLLHKMLMPNNSNGTYKIIKTLVMDDNNKELLNEVHRECKWVVCLDESIDKEILNADNRKIIGFSTGQGVFGEMNVTVSARQDIISDIECKLKKRLISKFSKWNSNIVEESAKFCVDLTKDLDGSRILKALNPNDYEIHNFLAYVLTIQNLELNENKNNFVIRSLINLDNHRHWFDTHLRDGDTESLSRADFLLLEIENNDQNLNKDDALKIKATVIECKMGYENEAHIDKAKKQVEHGIKVLANNFDPNASKVNKRYWFNQLYRALVFSKINIEDNKEEFYNLVGKMSNIYNGNFEIEWSGNIFAYWLNVNGDQCIKEQVEMNFDEYEFQVGEVNLFTAGQVYIQKLLLPDNERDNDFEFNEINNEKISENFLNEILNDSEELEVSDKGELSGETIVEKEIAAVGENTESTELVNNNEDRLANTSDKKVEVVDEQVEVIEELVSIEDTVETNISIDEKNAEEINEENHKTDKVDLNDVKFLIGVDEKTKEKIYWEFGNPLLNNRHLLINGNSGSGKTYCIQTLLLEAAKQDISVIVFDYTDGFTKSKLQPALIEYLGSNIEERMVKYKKFPINPFKKHKIKVGDEEFDELDVDIANRIASSFKAVYDFGPQQRNVIYQAIIDGLKEYKENMSFQYMAEIIEESKNSSASTVYSKIKPFIDYDPFLVGDDFSWKDITDSKGKVYIIQLSGFDRDIQVMLTEIILWDIWSYATKYGSEKVPMPIVLDEAHNLTHDTSSPSGRILAEGRKFGISGWFATQFMKGRLDEEEIKNLQQSTQKLYFSPPDDEINEVAKYIDVSKDGSKDWAEKLKKLTKGYCVTCGYGNKNGKFDKYKPTIVKVTSLEERINGER